VWLTDVDWETQDEPERQAEEGLRHASSVTETTCWEAEFFCCTAPQAVGLHMTKWAASRRGVHVPVNTDDRDAAAAAEAAQAEQAQRDREERRQLLALNKLGAAAIAVRRRWIKESLLSTTPPKGTALFLARAVASNPWLFDDYRGKQVAELLGTDPGQTRATSSKPSLPTPATTGA
jgi:ParB family chromosome partitioning protein